jgi:non-ribosomal peptide synthetase component E (peptide arylation enzyme)
MPPPYVDALQARAAAAPTRPALTAGATTLTRAELVASVERVATVFAEPGVGRGA